jgi:hypothetical protein
MSCPPKVLCSRSPHLSKFRTVASIKDRREERRLRPPDEESRLAARDIPVIAHDANRPRRNHLLVFPNVVLRDHLAGTNDTCDSSKLAFSIVATAMIGTRYSTVATRALARAHDIDVAMFVISITVGAITAGLAAGPGWACCLQCAAGGDRVCDCS